MDIPLTGTKIAIFDQYLALALITAGPSCVVNISTVIALMCHPSSAINNDWSTIATVSTVGYSLSQQTVTTIATHQRTLFMTAKTRRYFYHAKVYRTAFNCPNWQI